MSDWDIAQTNLINNKFALLLSVQFYVDRLSMKRFFYPPVKAYGELPNKFLKNGKYLVKRDVSVSPSLFFLKTYLHVVGIINQSADVGLKNNDFLPKSE